MAVAEMKIDQVGIPAGTNGRARSDGLADGSTVTLTATNPGATTATFSLLWVPIGDTTAVATLAPTGNPLVWEFTPTADRPGTYRIQLVTDVGLPSESDVSIRVFRVRTPAGLAIPALNEVADPMASLLNHGAAVVAASEDNEYVAGSPGTLGTFDYSGWFRTWHEMVMAVGGANPSYLDIRDYGAIAGSGSYAAANAVAIQAAIADSNTSGLPIFVPPGVFWSDALVLTGPEVFFGTGFQNSILKYAQTTGVLLSYVSPSADMNGSVFRNLGLEGLGGGSGSAIGYRGRVAGPSVPDNISVVFEGVKVYDFPTGVVVNDSSNVEFSDCEFVSNGDIGALTGGGVKFERVTFTAAASLVNNIVNCRFLSNSRGIFTDNDVNDSLANLTCQASNFQANGYGIWAAKSELLKLIGCRFSGQTTKAVLATNLLTIQSSQPSATKATTDAWQVSEQLVEFSPDYLKVSYGGVTIFAANATSADKWAEVIASSGGLKIGVSGNVRVYSNSGTPEGVVAADKGSLCVDYSVPSASLSFYVKTTDTVNTGWVPVAYVPRYGNTGSRPAANSVNVGTSYFNTDTSLNEFSNGTSWLQHNGQTAVSGTYASLPTATIDGARYWATDLNTLLVNDNGTYKAAWNSPVVASFANAGNYTFNGRGGHVINSNAATIATFTLNLPSTVSLEDGDVCILESSGQISAVTIASAATITGYPASILAFSTLRFTYIKATTTWVCVLVAPFATTDIKNLQSTSLSHGGQASANGNPALFDVAAGSGLVVDDSTSPPTVTQVSWSAMVGVAVTNLATHLVTWIGINSSGALVQQTTPWTTSQRRTTIELARIDHINHTSVNNIISIYQVGYAPGMEMVTFFDIFGPINVSGNVWSANGANLKINKSAGSSWFYGANYTTSKVNPSVTTDPSATAASFRYVYRDSLSAIGLAVTAAGTDIDPFSWDDAGTLTAATGGAWTVQHIYLVPDGINPSYYVQYGQKEYTTRAEAIAGITSDAYVSMTSGISAILCSRLVVQAGATDLTDTNTAEFFYAGRFGTQSISSAGSGGDVDTTGFVLIDGTRAMTGAFDAGGYPIRRLTFDVIHPPALAAQQDNYSPTGWSSADVVRLQATGSQLITGFNLTTTISRKLIYNIDTSGDNITLVHGSASSSIGNRLACPNGGNVILTPGSMCWASYDGVAAVWRISGSGDTTAFLLLDGTRAMTAALDMGTFPITRLGYNVISPPSISAQADNYAPTNWSTADVVRLVLVSSQTITGFSASATTTRKLIINYDNLDTLTLAHLSGSSLAANQISCPNGANVALAPGCMCWVIYDATSAVWRATGSSDSSVFLRLDGTRPMTGDLDMGTNALIRRKFNIIAPGIINAQQDNYSPTSFATADTLLVSLSGNQTITGFNATATTTRKRIINGDSVDTLTIANNSGSSSIANRVLCPGGVNLALPPGASCIIDYDTLTTVWRVLAADNVVPLDGSRPMTAALDMGGFRVARRAFWTISPAAFAAQQDNYNPTDFDICDIARLTSTGAQSITGFVASSAQTILKRIVNIGIAIITLVHESASSTAANRITCQGAANIKLAPGGVIEIFYEVATSRWRVAVIPSKFDDLLDVPSSKTGSAGMTPVVNAGESALAYRGDPGTFCFSLYANYNSGAGVNAAPRQTVSPEVTSWVPSTMRARLNTAPAVSSLTIDIKANGTSIINGSLPVIGTGVTTITANLLTAALAAGAIISVETIGTDTAWAGLEIEAYGTVRKA